MSTDLLLAAAAAGAGEATYVEGVFSTYLYTGNGGTQVIENGIALTDANSGGSVEFDGSGDYLSVANDASLNVLGSSFTIECWFNLSEAQSNAGLVSKHDGSGGYLIRLDTTFIRFYTTAGTIDRTYSFNQGEWYHVAVVSNGTTGTMYINGVAQGATFSTNGTNATSALQVGRTNTVTNDFGGYISNVRITNTAVYTSAFTPSTTALTDVSGTSLLTCQGDTPLVDNSSNALTLTVNGDAKARAFGPFTSETEGKGGLVWLKERSSTGNYSHNLYDTERGATKYLLSNSTNAEGTLSTGLTSFNANGFTHGSHMGAGNDVVSWTFAKQEKFFDVVTYTGTNPTPQNISHNLGSVPGMIIVKKTSAGDPWIVYHRSSNASPEDYYLRLNETFAAANNVNTWNSTAPTDSQFTVGIDNTVNENNATYVAYLFAHNDGDGIFGESGDQDIIKCGSYNGSDHRSKEVVELGFEPQFVLIKNITSTRNWQICDIMRGMPYGSNSAALEPNTSSAEALDAAAPNPTATGFFFPTRQGEYNEAGSTFIYIAIRRGPMKTPKSSAEVFATDITYSSTSPQYYSGFPVDFWLRRYNRYGSDYFIAMDRLRANGNLYLATTTTAAESLFSGTGLAQMDGADLNGTSSSYAYMFRRAPKFFDVVTWTGDGTSFNRRISHNLEQEPRFVLVKARNSTVYNWTLYYHFSSATVPHERFWFVNTGSPVYGTTGSYQYLWGNAPASTTDFGVGSYNNTANIDYIAYLFGGSNIATTGLYIGNGTSNTRYPTATPDDVRFLLIKEYSATSPWYVFDVERGIVAGNDPYLKLNTTDAEVTTTDVIDPVPGGFTVNQTATENLNADGSYYLYYAIK